MGRRVLITGVSGYWGTELARRLERSGRVRVHRRTRRQAARRRPRAHRVHPRRHPQPAALEDHPADRRRHRRALGHPARARAGQGARAASRHQRDRARFSCWPHARRRSTVRTIVVRGSAAIYGAEPNAPEFFTEAMARRFPLRTRFQRDVGELENYFETYSRRYPGGDGDDAALPAFARRRGSTRRSRGTCARRSCRCSSASTRCFSSSTPTTRSAALEAARAATRCPGPVNVAGEGSISLSRLLRLAGKLPLPVPVAPVRVGALGWAPLRAGASCRPRRCRGFATG